MKKKELKLPDKYISVLEDTRELLKRTITEKDSIIYIYAPPGFGKTTTLLKFFDESDVEGIFIEIEPDDTNKDILRASFLDILSQFNPDFKNILELYHNNIEESLFFDLLKNLKNNLPLNTCFVFSETHYLSEEIESFVKAFLYPIKKYLDINIIVESVREIGIKDSIIILDPNMFKLKEKDIINISEYFEKKIDYSLAYLIKEKTEGWIIPVLLLFSSGGNNIRDKIEDIDKDQIFDKLIESSFEGLNLDEKNTILGLGQLKEFDYESIRSILGYDDPQRIIRKIQEKCFVLIEEKKNSHISYHFHNIVRKWLQEKLKHLPSGLGLSIRINLHAMEYYESIHDFKNALYYAFNLKDYKKIGEYLKNIIDDIYLEGKIHELEDYFHKIGESNLNINENLGFCYGVYMIIKQNYKKAIYYIEKVFNKLNERDKLWATYLLLTAKYALRENKEIIIKESKKLIDRISEYEKKTKKIIDFEKDPYVLVKRRTFSSSEYFITLMYARIYNFLGIIFLAESDIDRAKIYFEESLKYLENIGNQRLMLVVISNLASVESILGNKKAMEYYRRLADYPVDFPHKVYSVYNLGLNYEIMEGDIEMAEKLYRKALEIAKKFDIKDKIIISLIFLMGIYAQKKDKDKFFEYAKEIEKIFKDYKNDVLLNEFYLEKTSSLILLGEFEEAKRIFEFVDFGKSKTESEYFVLKIVEGQILYLKGYVEEGKKHIKEFLSKLLNRGDYISKISTLENLYRFYEIMDEVEEKKKVQKMAKKLLVQKGHLNKLKNFDIRL